MSASFTTIDAAKVSAPEFYRLMIGAIVPRPIAFVSTLSPEGVGNLAPFSFFNGVSSNPPALMFSVTRKNDGSKKDTLRNIEATRQFVVNITNEAMVAQVNQASAEYPYGVDEMQKVGLTPAASEAVKPPRVSEAPVQFECELYGTMEVGDGTLGSATIIVGRILRAHVRDSLWVDDGHGGKKIGIHELAPLARLGGIDYSKLGEVIGLPRPKV